MPRHNSTPQLSIASVGQDLNSVLSAAGIAEAATEALGMDKNTGKQIKNVVIGAGIAYLVYQLIKAANK